jgi:hypothetical protein
MHSAKERERRCERRSEPSEGSFSASFVAAAVAAWPLGTLSDGTGHIVKEAACEGLWFMIVASAREKRPDDSGLATCGEECGAMMNVVGSVGERTTAGDEEGDSWANFARTVLGDGGFIGGGFTGGVGGYE